MKILYLVHQFYPDAYQGTEKFVLQLAQQQQAAGHSVKVITYSARASSQADSAMSSAMRTPLPLQTTHQRGRHPFMQGIKPSIRSIWGYFGIRSSQLRRLRALGDHLPNRIFSTEYEYQGVPVLSFCHRRRPVYLRQQLQDPSLTSFAWEVVQREQPDLIHAGHPMHLTEFLYAAHALQIPYLLTLTDFWLICWRCTLLNERDQLCHGPRLGNECRLACKQAFPPTRVEQRRKLAQQLLTQASRVVAPSYFLAGKLQAEYGTIPFKIIPYGIDLKKSVSNSRCYPTTKPLVFLFAGGLFKNKGIHLLLAAFRSLAAKAIQLEIYGSGPLLGEVQRAVEADERITYGGVYQSTELNDLLTQVDVVVVPSLWYENMPLIMQEAQAAGVPTLVADVGGMTECVTDGLNGFTFRMGDGADLQRKLQMIIDQPEILNQIKESMRNPQQGQYRATSLEEAAAMYMQVYEQIKALPPHNRLLGV